MADTTTAYLGSRDDSNASRGESGPGAVTSKFLSEVLMLSRVPGCKPKKRVLEPRVLPTVLRRGYIHGQSILLIFPLTDSLRHPRPGPQTLLYDPSPLVPLISLRPPNSICRPLRSLLVLDNSHILPLRVLLPCTLHRILPLRRTDRLRLQPPEHRFRARLRLWPGMACPFVGCAEVLWVGGMECG